MKRQSEASWANFRLLLSHFDVSLGSFSGYESDFGSLWDHFGPLFGTFCHLEVMLGSLLCDFEGPLGSIWSRFEHARMGLVSLRVYVNYFGIFFVGFQKIHICAMDFNDFMDLWSQLESTLETFCDHFDAPEPSKLS